MVAGPPIRDRVSVLHLSHSQIEALDGAAELQVLGNGRKRVKIAFSHCGSPIG